MFFAAKDGEALYSQQKQDWELPEDGENWGPQGLGGHVAMVRPGGVTPAKVS